VTVSDLVYAGGQGCVGGGADASTCDPEVTIGLLRMALTPKPEDVDLELVFELVAQLVTDLRGWVPDHL
jgi:hypothetical protein